MGYSVLFSQSLLQWMRSLNRSKHDQVHCSKTFHCIPTSWNLRGRALWQILKMSTISEECQVFLLTYTPQGLQMAPNKFLAMLHYINICRFQRINCKLLWVIPKQKDISNDKKIFRSRIYTGAFSYNWGSLHLVKYQNTPFRQSCISNIIIGRCGNQAMRVNSLP